MGADNWRICPRCKKIAEVKHEKQTAKVQKLYSKVSAEEYAEKLAELENDKFKPLGETLSEYYEIRTNIDGVFTVDYNCACRNCGFSFSFKEERSVQP